MRAVPAELRKFLKPYAPHVVQAFLAARQTVLTTAPDAVELLYDAYNAVSAAYSFTDRLKEAFCHVAAYRGYVNLGFNRGARLPDPDRVLVGNGANIRHIRINDIGDLERPAVQRLVHAAVAQARRDSPAAAAKPYSIVKAVYAKRRRPTR